MIKRNQMAWRQPDFRGIMHVKEGHQHTHRIELLLGQRRRYFFAVLPFEHNLRWMPLESVNLRPHNLSVLEYLVFSDIDANHVALKLHLFLLHLQQWLLFLVLIVAQQNIVGSHFHVIFVLIVLVFIHCGRLLVVVVVIANVVCFEFRWWVDFHCVFVFVLVFVFGFVGIFALLLVLAFVFCFVAVFVFAVVVRGAADFVAVFKLKRFLWDKAKNLVLVWIDSVLLLRRRILLIEFAQLLVDAVGG
mmetsp:Transcript_51405/g.81931  ORF Transcript_51405/g.81931 Transcript_51405/m.81931 type:complete len:246 (+) Transcript_51405:378-1115(+)